MYLAGKPTEVASLAFSGFEDGLRDREVDDVSSGGVSTTASLGGRSGTFESGFCCRNTMYPIARQVAMPTTSAARIKLQDATVRPSTAGRYHSFRRSGVAYPQRQSQGHHRARRGAAAGLRR